MITPDATWTALGVSEQTLHASAVRLSERKDLPQPVHRFFEQAGTLMLHSWYSYPFASIAFFHAVLGVERALRFTFDADPDVEKFKALFARAVKQGIIHDGVFEAITPVRGTFVDRVPAKLHKELTSYAAVLAELVPRLRNEYFHGEYIMSNDFLPLSLRLREAADALAAFKQPQGRKGDGEEGWQEPF